MVSWIPLMIMTKMPNPGKCNLDNQSYWLIDWLIDWRFTTYRDYFSRINGEYIKPGIEIELKHLDHYDTCINVLSLIINGHWNKPLMINQSYH